MSRKGQGIDLKFVNKTFLTVYLRPKLLHYMGELKWYQKPLSIKQQDGLPEKIQDYVSKLPDPAPANAKELILSLLEYAETCTTKEVYEESVTALNKQIDAEKERADQYYTQLTAEKEETNSLRLENERLLEETKRLQQENDRLSSEETHTEQWFEGLRILAPEFVREEDKTFEDSFARILFALKQEREAVNQTKEKVESLETSLRNAEAKKIELKPNEAIIEFTPEQQENIRFLRRMLVKSGTIFKTQDVNEVIHTSVANNIEHVATMVAMCKKFGVVTEMFE